MALKAPPGWFSNTPLPRRAGAAPHGGEAGQIYCPENACTKRLRMEVSDSDRSVRIRNGFRLWSESLERYLVAIEPSVERRAARGI